MQKMISFPQETIQWIREQVNAGKRPVVQWEYKGMFLGWTEHGKDYFEVYLPYDGFDIWHVHKRPPLCIIRHREEELETALREGLRGLVETL